MNPVEYASNVTGWMMPDELAWLSKTAAGLRPGARWLEVGSWMGKSWSCVALSLPEGCTIVAVDTFDGGTYGEPMEYVAKHGSVLPDFCRVCDDVLKMRPDLVAVVVVAHSEVAASLIGDGTFDAAFIDADHKVEAVSVDLRAWLPKLKAGGLLCGHDIAEAGVRKALGGYKYTYDPLLSGSIWWLK